eukprot:gene8186-14_t
MSDITITALGKTGDGKSTLLNTLFDKEEFRTAAEDGRVTLSTVTEHGFWRGDKKHKLTCIDTPGLVDKTPFPSSASEQAGFENIYSFIEHLSKGFNAFLLCFDITKADYDFQYESMLSILGIILGNKIFDHMIVVFTHCEGDKFPELKKKMETEFRAKITKSLNRELTFIYTKKGSDQGLDELKNALDKMDKYDSKFFQELRKIQEDDSKTKLDEERYIEKQFQNALYSNICGIL